MATVLDWERALENTDGSEELLLELAGVFLEECPKMMRQIKAAIDERDAPGLQLAAHSLKGSVRIFAASAATDAALALENIGTSGDLSGAEDRRVALSQEIDRLKAILAERSGEQAR